MDTFIERPRFSCALGGAMSTISSMPDVIPIVHAAIGCAGNLNSTIMFGSGYLGDGYCGGGHIPTSAVTERKSFSEAARSFSARSRVRSG